MALPKKPPQENFMDHLAPDTVGGQKIKSVQQEFHKIQTRQQRECAGDTLCCPAWDSEDFQTEHAFRNRGRRGGANFSNKDILLK